MRPCPYCGHEVLKSERYCPNCGRIRKAPISLDKYSLGMIENFKQCFVYKYADFEGRASRSEYWNFFLVYQLLFVIGTLILLVLMALPGESHTNRFGLPTGHVILTKQMAHEIGLIDATPTTGLTAGLLCAIFVLWFLVDRLLMTSVI